VGNKGRQIEMKTSGFETEVGIFALTALVIRLSASIRTGRRVFIRASYPTIARFADAVFEGALSAKYLFVR
jgi:hypothetical protein